MVIYFSGTGNSKYVASAIASKLSDELVCSNDYIKAGKKGVFTSSTPYIFVFPIYLSTIAEIFANFIRESEFSGNTDAYFVATCAGALGAAPNVCKEICIDKHMLYKGAEKVVMPQNYIALFTMTEKSEIEKRQYDALTSAEMIAEIVKKGDTLNGKEASGFESKMTLLVEKLYNGRFTKTKKFFATDECVGCKICEKACPINNIEIVDGKPKWKGSCIHCMACINRCPKAAIEYGKGTKNKERYVCKEYNN